MNFDKTYITDEGTSILAASLNNEYTIQWGNVYTTNVDLSTYTEQAIHGLTLTDFPQNTYTSSGVVQNVLVNRATNTANVYSEINNASFNGTAKSFIVLAKFPSDQSYSLVMVAYCDQATPTIVPGNTEPFIAHVNFDVEVSDHSVSTVTSASGWYASNDAFQNLANCTVTTHSLNDSTTGENQNILGNKTFKNNLIATTILPETHASTDSIGNDIGSSNNKFRAIYSQVTNTGTLYSNDITTDTFGSNGLAYFYDDIECTADLAVGGKIEAGSLECSGYLTANNDIIVKKDVYPYDDEYSDLGQDEKKWNHFYTREAYVKDKLRIVEYSNTNSDIRGIQFMSDYQNDRAYITVSGNTDWESGNYSDLEFKFVVSPTSNTHNYFIIATSYTTSGDIVTYPSVNGKWDLGKVSGNNSYKLNRVYANEFIGHTSTATGLKYTSHGTRLVIEAVDNNCVVPNGNDVYLGDSTRKFKEVHTNKVYTDEVHADSLSGILPSVETISGKKTIQVGCIFLGIVTATITDASSPTEDFSIGDVIQPSRSRLSVYPATFWVGSNTQQNNGWKADTTVTIPTGAKFKALSSGFVYNNCTAPGMLVSNGMLALMMRIE